MSTDPKIQAALDAAKIRAQQARAMHPEFSAPSYIPTTPNVAPSPPPLAPAVITTKSSEGLQTASFDALIREVDRRKTEALAKLRDLDLSLDDLTRELALRQLSMEALETLRNLPTTILREEVNYLENLPTVDKSLKTNS